MKNSLVILLFVTFSVSQLFGQTPTFSKGDRVLNLGLGFGTTLYSGSYYKSQVPPLSASFEIGVADEIIDKGVIGVGGYLGYSSYKYEYNNWGWKYSNLIIGARGNFHYPFVDDLDTYTGLLLGYNISSSSEFGTMGPGLDYSASSGGLVYSWFIGARYYFKENLAAMAELGYGITYLNLGVAFKF